MFQKVRVMAPFFISVIEKRNCEQLKPDESSEFVEAFNIRNFERMGFTIRPVSFQVSGSRTALVNTGWYFAETLLALTLPGTIAISQRTGFCSNCIVAPVQTVKTEWAKIALGTGRR